MPKLYNTKRWQQLRKAQLNAHPMCQCPHCQEKMLEADTVDHITPHRGDKRLFFDRHNLQSMHHDCHDKYKQSHEKGGAGFMAGCDDMGRPLSLDHSWYTR